MWRLESPVRRRTDQVTSPVQELKSIVPLYLVHGLKNNSVFSEFAGAHTAQYRMRSAELKNHLNHNIVTTKVWDFKIRYQIVVLLSKVFMSLLTRGPGRRDTCHLADFLQTFTAYKGH